MTKDAPNPFQNRRRQDRGFEALHEVSRLLTTTLDVDELLNAVVRLVVEKLRIRACTIRLLDEATGEMVLRAVHGLSKEYVRKGPVVVWKGVFRELLADGGVIAVSDVTTDPRVQYPQEARREGVQSMLAVALMSEGRAFGGLCAYTDHVHEFDDEERRTFEIIASQAAVGLQAAFLHRELVEKRVMDRELELAERVQNNFMPQRLQITGRYDINARALPCLHIGGDFYELVELDDGSLGVAIGDVSGKGIGASILMATTRASLRAHIENVPSVSGVMSRVNRALCRDSGEDQFVSLFYMVIAPDGTVTYSNGGHCRPMLVHDDRVSELAVGGPVLGVGDWVKHREGMSRLEKGDVMLLYTDGLTEVFSADGAEFGVQRLGEVLLAGKDRSSDEIADSIYEAAESFSGYRPPADDRTLVVVRAM